MLSIKKGLKWSLLPILEILRNWFLMTIIMCAHRGFRWSACLTPWKLTYISFSTDFQLRNQSIRRNNFIWIAKIERCHIIHNSLTNLCWNQMLTICCVIQFIMSERPIWRNTFLTETTDNNLELWKMYDIRVNVLRRHIDGWLDRLVWVWWCGDET